jgi:hypothetical protein
MMGLTIIPSYQRTDYKKKGDIIWQALEITGSNKGGSGKKAKFALKTWFQEVEIPRLADALAQRRLFELGGVGIIMRYQWDSAGPHQDKTLIKFLQYEFSKRGWLFVCQPSQSPLTNVKDACIFPALSKKVAKEQGLSNGSLSLEGEKLWDVCRKVWDEFPEETIARAYAGHHQIGDAIYAEEGGDKFQQVKGGLHYGIRKAFVPTFGQPDKETGEVGDPVGIELFEAPEEVDATELKYPSPKAEKEMLENCENYCTSQELEFMVQECENQLQELGSNDEDQEHII